MNSRLVDQIEAFILLDLLGAANPQFRSFYENTEGLHFRLTEIEHYLQDKKLISNRRAMFIPQVNFGGVDDDHRPFLEKGISECPQTLSIVSYHQNYLSFIRRCANSSYGSVTVPKGVA